MSIDIYCNKLDICGVSMSRNAWIVGDEHGISLPPATIAVNLAKYYHDMFMRFCDEDLRERNKKERKPMSMKEYMRLGFHKQFEWCEEMSKKALALKDRQDVEFYLL